MDRISGGIETGYVRYARLPLQQVREKNLGRMSQGAGQSHTCNNHISLLIHFFLAGAKPNHAEGDPPRPGPAKEDPITRKGRDSGKPAALLCLPPSPSAIGDGLLAKIGKGANNGKEPHLD